MDFRDWLKDDHYNLLGVTQMSTADEINKAYRQQAKCCHPDVFPLNSIERYQAEHKFKQILNARDTLLDPERRNEYDNERQLYQDCYLTSMRNNYSCEINKKRESGKSSFRNEINQYRQQDYFNSSANTKEDKTSSYKKQGAKKYYAMCLRAVSQGDYNRALIYFQSSKQLDPSLQMPPSLWTLISKVKYNI